MSDEVVLISLQAVYGNAYPRKTSRAKTKREITWGNYILGVLA